MLFRSDYYIVISHLAYQNIKLKYTVEDKGINAGTLKIEAKDLALNEIKVAAPRLLALKEVTEKKAKIN